MNHNEPVPATWYQVPGMPFCSTVGRTYGAAFSASISALKTVRWPLTWCQVLHDGGWRLAVSFDVYYVLPGTRLQGSPSDVPEVSVEKGGTQAFRYI